MRSSSLLIVILANHLRKDLEQERGVNNIIYDKEKCLEIVIYLEHKNVM